MRAFERMEGESSRAFQGFAIYRDLGPQRSLAKAAALISAIAYPSPLVGA